MYGNGTASTHLGIDLQPADGPNYPQNVYPEQQAGSANRNQHFPQIATATANPTTPPSITITGNVPTNTPTAVLLEFFWGDNRDDSGFGEGQNFIGVGQPDSAGNFNITLTNPPGAPAQGLAGKWITATATRNLTGGNGETSEFAQAFRATQSTGITGSPPTNSIRVVEPVAGQVVRIGSRQAIRWTSTVNSGAVEIKLSRDGGRTFPEILFADTPNNGDQTWVVTGPSTRGAIIKITTKSNPSVSSLSRYFTIVQ
jgi:hypothetical protein